jgi:hypothetical protein
MVCAITRHAMDALTGGHATMTWDPLAPLTIDDPPTAMAGPARASLLDGILQRLRTSRGPLIFAATVQFLTAAVVGLLTIGYGLLLIAVAQSQDIFSPNTESDYAFGVLLAGVVALHILLGIGVLRRRRWALVTAVCLSPFSLVVTYFLATHLSSGDPLFWLQRPAIIALALIVIADLVLLLQLKRTDQA